MPNFNPYSGGAEYLPSGNTPAAERLAPYDLEVELYKTVDGVFGNWLLNKAAVDPDPGYPVDPSVCAIAGLTIRAASPEEQWDGPDDPDAAMYIVTIDELPNAEFVLQRDLKPISEIVIRRYDLENEGQAGVPITQKEAVSLLGYLAPQPQVTIQNRLTAYWLDRAVSRIRFWQ